jgi:hypothetical protein
MMPVRQAGFVQIGGETGEMSIINHSYLFNLTAAPESGFVPQSQGVVNPA